jgi:hypothetical protein
MPGDDRDRLEIGEVRFHVFTDPVSEMPWLARLRLASLTPAGLKATWIVDVGEGPEEPHYTCRTRHFIPPADPIAAIEQFQRDRVSGSRTRPDKQLDIAVRQVVEAEAMKDAARDAIAARRERDAMLARLAASDGGT